VQQPKPPRSAAGGFVVVTISAAIGCSSSATSVEQGTDATGDENGASGANKSGPNNGSGGTGDCSCNVSVNGEKKTLTCGESACVGDDTYSCGEDGKLAHTEGCETVEGEYDDAGITPKSTDAGKATNDAGSSQPMPKYGATFVISGKTISCQTVSAPVSVGGGYGFSVSSCDNKASYVVSAKSVNGATGKCGDPGYGVNQMDASGKSTALKPCTVNVSHDFSNGTFKGTISGTGITGTFLGSDVGF